MLLQVEICVSMANAITVSQQKQRVPMERSWRAHSLYGFLSGTS